MHTTMTVCGENNCSYSHTNPPTEHLRHMQLPLCTATMCVRMHVLTITATENTMAMLHSIGYIMEYAPM